MYVYMWVLCMCERSKSPQSLERVSGPLEVEYGGCEPLDMGAGTQIQALSKQSGSATEPPL